MGYTVNFCQLNYIVHWFEDYIKKRKIILFQKIKTCTTRIYRTGEGFDC